MSRKNWLMPWKSKLNARPGGRSRLALESLETRDLMAADPLPVLMVLADQRDFVAQESGDACRAAEQPAMAAKSTNDYSAIVFVGGWGSSMYQYAFKGSYSHSASGPMTTADEVVVDGPIITAENYDSAHTLDSAAVDRVFAAGSVELADPELMSAAPSPLSAQALAKTIELISD